MKQTLILFFFLMGSGLHAQTSSIGPFKTSVGEQVPDFSIETLAGDKVEIKDLKGKIVLLNFWATWCGPCVQEMPELNKFVSSLDSDNFVVLAIARKQDKETIKGFLSDKDYSFTFAPDVDKSIYLQFADSGIPRNVLLDAKGKIIFQSLGYKLEEFKKMESMIVEEVGKLSN